MTKSAFVEVNITNPTKLAQDSQDTANTAVKGVTDLNDPNLMSVIEKQNNIGRFAGLTSQFSVLIQNAKDDGIDTTAVTTAYNNLNRFMADILADPNHASDVDRVIYKKYQDAYNEELVNLQNALQNNTNNKFTSAANATSQAASTASQAFSAANGAFSQAQLIGSQADSAIAVQSQATAKAQSTADSAFSQAQVIGSQASADISSNSMATAKAQSTADDAFSQAQAVGSQASAEIAKQSEATLKAQNTADSAFKQAQSATDYTDKQIASQASAVSEVSKNASEASSQANNALDAANSANAEITNLKGGSTLTIAKLEDGLGTKVDNSDFSTYKTQTASQFAETVKEADFKTYQTQTSKLIEAKVDNGTYQSDKTQTAKDISSKVSSSDFNTYKTQTADLINDKVSNSEYASNKEQTASQIADRVSNSAFSTYQEQTASQIASKVDNGDFTTYKTQTADLIASKVATKDFSAYQATTAKSIESKVESSDFNTYKTQTDKMISSKVESSDFQAYQTQVKNSAVGTNLLLNSKGKFQPDKSSTDNWYVYDLVGTSIYMTQGQQYTVHANASSGLIWSGTHTGSVESNKVVLWLVDNKTISTIISDANTGTGTTFTWNNPSGTYYLRVNTYKPDNSGYVENVKIEKGSVATDWSLNPEDQATQSQITQLSGEIEQKVDSGDFSTYKTQTANLIGSKVDNGDFSTYQKQTADLISAKVSTKDFSAYQDTTAKAISSKVGSSDFNTYKTQTAGLISSKVDSDDFSTYKTQTDKLIESKVDNGAYQSDKTQTANDIASKVANKDFETYKSQTADLISSKVATKDFNTYTSQTATAISSKVESSDFNTYKTQTDSAINDKVSSAKYMSDKTQTDDAILSKVSKKDANNVNLIPYSSNFSDSLEGWQLMAWGATDRKLLVTTHSFYKNGTGKLLYLNTAQNATSAAGSLRFSVLPNTEYTFQFKAFASSNVVGANVYFLSRAYGSTSDYDTAHGLFNNLVTSPSHIDQYTVTFTTGANDNEGYIRVDNIGSSNGASSGLFFTELKMEPGDTATNYVYGGQDSMIFQMSDDINLRVTKDDLIDQINVQAGKTLISSSGQLTLSGKNIYFDSTNPVIIPSANIDTALVNKKLTAADIGANTFTTNNGTFTVKQDGSITAKNMTLIGGTLSTPTINAGVISGSTINGTTLHGGDIINNANNMSHFYPTTISSNGHIYTTMFNSADAMQTDLSTGSLTTKYRATNSSSNQYEAYDTNISANQIVLSAGHTNGKDMSFSQSVTGSNQDGYVLISPLDGLTFKGDNQQITFSGTSGDVTPKGIIITPYGNINPVGTQNIWYVGNGPAMKTASFGINADQNVPISLYRQTLVDEIGALGNRLDMGRLFLHATDNDAQMYLLNDGSPAFVSPTVFNRTYSNGANMFVTSAGRIGRSTSASKYKLAIARSDDTVQADRLMTLKPASWNDKVATEKMAESLSNGEIPVEAEINLKRHYGLIAEDLRDAGLDEFLITGKDGQIEGIEYDRLWTVLIPKIKQLNNRINELERKTL